MAAASARPRFARASALLRLDVGLEESAQLHPAAVKAALERRLTDAGDPRGLARRQALEVAQDDGVTPLGGQLAKGLLDGALELTVECLGGRLETRRVGKREDGVIAIRSGFGGRRPTA